MAVSETFLRADQPTDLATVSGYSAWQTERSGTDKCGGGLCIFYRNTLSPHCWSPPVSPKLAYVSNERQWLILTSGNERLAVLHIYVACQSHSSDGYLQWNEDLFHLVTTESIRLRKEGFCVLALGDFNSRVGQIQGLEGNTPDTNNNTPMFMNFIAQVNLVILNTLPLARGLFTRFMDSSGKPGTRSLLDYGAIDDEHVGCVTSFVIDEQARYECGSDHALLICILTFGSRQGIQWSFQDGIQYNFSDNTDFTDFKANLENIVSSIPLHEFSKLSPDEMYPHISESLNKSGKSSFGLKIKTKKTKGIKLPRSLIQKIQLKNSLSRHISCAHKSDPILFSPSKITQMEQDLSDIKSEIKDLLREQKIRRRNRIRSKLLHKDPTRKKFWRFLKSQIKCAGQITGAYKAGQMVFDQLDIEEAILDHFENVFKGQRHPVFIGGNCDDQTELSLLELDALLSLSPSHLEVNQFESKVCQPFSFTELELTLGMLPSGKSSGYDRIPHELLKNSGFVFKQYLLTFLNLIIKKGEIPSAMNIGKCMLIHKVSKNEP